MEYSSRVIERLSKEVREKYVSKWKENEIEWTPDVEVLFFYSLIGHKPVGVNKCFMMLLVHHKFCSFLNHQLSSKVLWDRLDTLYDMAALHESEVCPFPDVEKEYELPEDCYDLLYEKYGVDLRKSNSESNIDKNSSNSVKALKKPTPKVKQSGASGSKPLKNSTVVKSETKINSNESTSKVKKESGSSSKAKKIGRSCSPFSTKLSKSEPVSSSKEASADVAKKFIKSERGASPAITKKPPKPDPSSSGISFKKTPKPDPSSSGISFKKTPKSESSSSNWSKPIKVEKPGNSMKKFKSVFKVEKEMSSKKGKAGSPAEVHTKKVKVDANGVKKKSEAEGNSKRTSETNSVTKSVKPESKSLSSKGQDAETPTPSGSRKSSPVVKVKSSDNSSSYSSNKKLKRPTVEEPSKKPPFSPKRRRP